MLNDLLGRSVGIDWVRGRSSEAGAPSARGLSNFRRLFLRVRRRPSAKRAESIREIFNRQAQC
jgi:hypothetical protein